MARAIFEAEHYEHGTRARYSVGCRCDRCREAKRLHTRERDARARAAAVALPNGDTADGMCPGVKGEPCPSRARLVSKSVGGVCRKCRERLISNPLIEASAVREHLRALSAKGVGCKAVASQARVAQSVLARILSGEQKVVRENVAQSVLAVNESAMADGARVPAGPTVRLVKKMLALGLTKGEIARRLGGRTKLQVSTTLVRVSTARAIERLWNEVKVEKRPKAAEPGTRIGPFVLERTESGIVQRRVA